MKKIFSLLLVLVMMVGLSACRGTPRTVTITRSNFYDYFDISSSFDLPIYNTNDLGTFVYGDAVIVIEPLFDGEWSELNYDVVWKITGNHSEYTSSFYLPDNMKGDDVTSITIKTAIKGAITKDRSAKVQILRLDNVSGIITVYE